MSECKDIHLELTAPSSTSMADDSAQASPLTVLPVPGSEPAPFLGPNSFEDLFFAFIVGVVFGGALLLVIPSLGAARSRLANITDVIVNFITSA